MYNALALLCVATVAFGKYQYDRVRAVYVDSVRQDAIWIRYDESLARLQALVGAVDAPANDVFANHNVARERLTLETATRRLRYEFTIARQQFEGSRSPSESRILSGELRLASRDAEVLIGESHQVLFLYDQGRMTAAGKAMAQMDHQTDRTHGTLEHVRRLLSGLRKQNNAEGTDRVVSFSQFGSVFAVLMLLVVCGTMAYAYVLKGQSEQAAMERERQMEALRQARDAAEAGTRAKSEFLAGMSHEMRTPMNAIIGTADLLTESTLSDEQREHVAMLRRSGDNLLLLIDDILALTEIEANRLELKSAPFQLRELGEGAVKAFTLGASEKGLELTYNVAPDMPHCVCGDADRLRLVLANLVGNAVKFTERGGVSLRIVRGTEADTVRFEVTDTGIGIPADKLEWIFETFSQVDASSTRRFGGTGIGLAIARRLVRRMGGEIEVRSSEGQGSAFSFVIPLPQSAVLPPSAERGADGAASSQPLSRHAVGSAPLRVLLVEDSSDNRLLIQRYLQHEPVLLDFAENGAEGVRRFQECEYDLVLMDIQMPVMDGFTATQAIRHWEREQQRSPTPIVALTAHALAEHEELSRSAGCTAFATKPIRKARLLELMGELTETEQ